jgi:hypothetical protein
MTAAMTRRAAVNSSVALQVISPIPPEKSIGNRLSTRWLFGIGLVAVAARLFAIVWLDAVSSLPASAFEHASIARYLCDGQGFAFHFYGPDGSVVPTSQQAPLMAMMLAGCYRLLGIESTAAFGLALVIQSLAGGLAVVHLTRLTHLMFEDRRVSIVAGLLGGLGPAWVVAPAHIQAVTWNLLAVAMMIEGVMLIERDRRWIAGKYLFIVSNILAWHVDPIIAAVGGVLFLVRLLARWNARESLAVVLAIALGVLPWSLRNIQVHGRPIFIKNSFWYVFWQGNTAASHGTDKLFVGDDATPNFRVSVDETMPAEFLKRLRSMPSEIERMDAFGPLIREELSRQPVQYIEKCLLRLRQWIWFDETNRNSRSIVYRTSYWALIALSVIGGWSRPRDRNRGTAILIAIGVMSLFSILIITSARFRLPVEFLLVPWGAAGLLVFARQNRRVVLGAGPNR